MPLDTTEYNATAQALLEPFDESEIKKRQGAGGKWFSYVPPEQYRYRILKVFSEGFTFGLVPGSLSIGKEGAFGVFAFEGTVTETGARYSSPGIPVFEEWTVATATFPDGNPNPKAGQVLGRSETVKMLTSAGLKAVLREFGVGLHLYDKADTVASQPSGGAANGTAQQSGGAPAGGGDYGEWTGEVTIKKEGKNFGKKWSELPEDTIEFLCSLQQPNALALKERARRAALNGTAATPAAATAGATAAAPAAEESEDELPF